MAGWAFDVFLSFRGQDIRQNFIGHLYEALRSKGFHIFLDEEKLESGQDIPGSLIRAIEESRIAILLFSDNYATSSFCLNELVKIMECAKAEVQMVLPVFYDVDPSHVRHLRGSYGEALVKHEERFKSDNNGILKEVDMEKLEKWKMALKQAANLSGKHFKIGGDDTECKLIEKIVNTVSKCICRGYLHVAYHPVGLESQVLKVNSHLDVGSVDVHMLGIYGIGGIGKTTLARAVYNSIAESFEGVCFLGMVREKSMTHGLEHLQEIMLSKLLGEDIKLGDVSEGVSMIERRFNRKKVLLVVDDVDNMKQLEAIVGNPRWFSSGSRIIITTRNKGLLASYGVERTYQVEELNEKEALNLLRFNAFKNDEVDPSYADILNSTVTYASGLPLALEVIGSNLFGRSLEEWQSALEQYERIPIKEIQKILKVSFDDLEDDENGSNKIGIIKLTLPKLDEKVNWDGNAFKKMDNLRTLIINEGGFLEGPKHLPNSLKVLKWAKYPSEFLPSHFCPKELVLFQLPYSCVSSVNMLQMQERFMNLRDLDFNNCKFIKQIPDVSVAPNLEKLSFRLCVNVTEVHPSVGLLGKLRKLDACHCSALRSFPALLLPSLEYLDFSWCSNLENFPDIKGKMENLIKLELCHTHIKAFPFSIRFLTKLQTLEMRFSGIVKLPSSMLELTELQKISIYKCDGLLLYTQDEGEGEGEEQVSSAILSIQHNFEFIHCNISDEFLQIGIPLFTNVNKLNLSWNTFTILPACIKGCSILKELILDHCEKLREIQGIPPNIEIFSAKHCGSLKVLDLTLIPTTTSTKECHFLKEIFLNACMDLRKIRGIPPSIEVLHAPKCTSLTSSLQNQDLHKGGSREFWLPMLGILEWFNHSCHGSSISFWFRNKFPAISVCVINEHTCKSFRPKLIINNHEVHEFSEFSLDTDHLSILVLGKLLTKFKVEVDDVLSKNGWNHVVFFSNPKLQKDQMSLLTRADITVQIGLHVFQRSSMEDIRFTDPKKDHRRWMDTGHSPKQFMKPNSRIARRDSHRAKIQLMQQKQNLAPSEGRGTSTTTANQNLNFDLDASVANQINSTTIVQASQDHQLPMAPGESCQTPDILEPPSIQAPSPTSSSSSELSGPEIYTETEFNEFDDPLSRNQDHPVQENIEMEAFYVSLEAKARVLSSFWGDKHANNTATNEETKKALMTVQDFISQGASILLRPEQGKVMKANLDYLSNLTTDDGISEGMKTLISEASWLFNHWSRDYTEACMKIEFTNSELQRAYELEAGMEDNKNQFWEVVGLENELKDQINAIKAYLATCESEKDVAVQRKREIFEEGKTLKSQIDRLKEKMPQLQHEQGLAKIIREKISSEWSNLGEKFKTTVDQSFLTYD
ncbi:TMV resistance protein N [Arachis hypogaea]|nr:TMV resistance protein N [Arachis hypogaea]